MNVVTIKGVVRDLVAFIISNLSAVRLTAMTCRTVAGRLNIKTIPLPSLTMQSLDALPDYLALCDFIRVDSTAQLANTTHLQVMSTASEWFCNVIELCELSPLDA